VRRRLALALLLLVASACADGAASEVRVAAPEPGPLHLTTADGLAAVDPDTGQVDFQQPGAVSSPDGSVVARAITMSDGGRRDTRISWLDSATGDLLHTTRMAGSASIRVVAPDGRVALGPADVPAGPLPYPVPRSVTRLVVADGEEGGLRTYHVEGNVEPEAFSADGSGLFVLSYSPPLNPTQYQVDRLDLDTGELGGVYGPDGDQRQERMAATARTQAWAPDGEVVYTLYTTYSAAGAPTSFVHVLNVAEGWAYCLGLPEPVGSDSAAAITVSPDSSRLWTADATGRAAVVDTDDLAVLRSGSYESAGYYGLSATSDGERLYLGSDDRITVLDGSTLQPETTWETSRMIIALRLPEGSDRLVAVTDGQLTTFALDEARAVGRDLPFTDQLAVVDPSVPQAECAC
jgi:hypothetical protein